VDQPPVVTKHSEPKYSKQAQNAKVEGIVVLGAVVDTDGRAHDIKVLTGLGHGLDEEAIKCVEKWRFTPAKSRGNPVPLRIHMELKFKLFDRR
jgi:TonB family protein